VADGFEVAEWGPHDVLFGEVLADRPEVREIVARTDPHPFTRIPYGPGFYDGIDAKLRLASACIEGAGRRASLATRLLEELTPAMALLVFTEVHHVTHQMWHTVEPDAPVYEGLIGDRVDVSPNLLDVYREVDRQLGSVIEAAGSDTAVAAFSLHGMGPAPGIPTFLDPLLSALGYAAPAGWSGSSWRDRGVALFAAAKRRAPSPIKSAYHRLVSHRAVHRIARSTMVPPHDWSRTRAFSLPSDQYGYVRVNLAGREAQGAVPEREYGPLCDELVDSLTGITDDDGRPLVDRVVRTAVDGEPPEHLPDIVLHWSDAGFRRPVRIAAAGVDLEAHPIRTDMTGGHRDHGFCVLDERLAAGPTGDVLPSPELQRLLLAGLAARLGVPST
jgi:predicted AlkP superfamily phosphohydrolase/phosphomutase